jgi:sulfate permease, SulP family
MTNIAGRRDAGTRVARWVPIVGWLPAYRRGWLSADVIAGFTLWGLLIPEMIAYASLAGLPPQAGLYTLLATLVIYAVFGTSKHLVVAGTSASAVLMFSAVTELKPKDAASYAALAAGLIALTGILFIVAGLLRLGFITEFLSRPVMEGFVFGLAIFVSVSQLPKILGLEKGEGNTLRQLGHLIVNLGNASATTAVVGAVALLVLFGLERRAPRIPGGLVVLVLGIAVSALFNLSSHGVAIVGDIPSGLPSVQRPRLHADELWVLIPSALGMMLVIFSEALGVAKTYADKHGYRIDSNQEMVALGLANIGSSLLRGLAGGGSLSQTAVNEGAGARSEASPIFAALLSLITVIALTPVFHDLPEAVLAALVIHAVSRLMKIGVLLGFYRLHPSEFWLGIATLAGVVVLGVLPGLVMGVVVSIVLVLARLSRPGVSILGRDPDVPSAYVSLARHPDARPIPGVLIVQPKAPLFYANAQGVRDAIDEAVSSMGDTIHAVVLDLDATDELDITSSVHLLKLRNELEKRGVELRLAHVHTPTLRIVKLIGLLDQRAPEHVFPNVDAAVRGRVDL